MKAFWYAAPITALIILGIALLAVIGPFLVNDAGTIGLISLPFIALLYLALVAWIIKGLFSKPSKETTPNA